MAQYKVFGPFPVEVRKVGKTRRIFDKKKVGPEDAALKLLGLNDWWAQDSLDKLRSCKGCYVFAMRAGKGSMPVYVGKTSEQTFEKEVFNNANIKNMNGVLAERKGTLILYLVSTGRTNAQSCHVDEIETWLIEQARQKNDKLLNKQKTKGLDWSIVGLKGDGRTAPSASATELAKTLNLEHKKNNIGVAKKTGEQAKAKIEASTPAQN